MAIEEFIVEDEPFNIKKHIIPQYSFMLSLVGAFFVGT
jgi:hypothetical protein